MDKKTLYALLLAASSCFPPKQETTSIPVVDILIDQNAANYKRITEKTTPKQLSSEILQNLHFASPEASRKVSAEPFDFVVYYGSIDIDNPDALQYFVANQAAGNMIIFEDIKPYGSLDTWHRCPQHEVTVRNMFKCYTMGLKDKYVDEVFEQTIEMVHSLSQDKNIAETWSYLRKYDEILSGDHGPELYSGVYPIPW